MTAIIEFMRNVWKFKKQLWEYRPYDHHYLESMLSAMYRDMANHIEEHNIFVGCEKVAHRARVIAYLIDNYQDISDPLYEKLIDEWWASREEIPQDNDTVLMKFPEDAPSKRRLINKRRKREEAITNHRIDLLFKYIRKYHRRLWC